MILTHDKVCIGFAIVVVIALGYLLFVKKDEVASGSDDWVQATLNQYSPTKYSDL